MSNTPISGMKVGLERSNRKSEFSTLASLMTFAIVIAALYFGKDVLVPLALALLLSFLLSTPVGWLEKLRLGRALSIVLVLTFVVAASLAIFWLGITQLTEIVSNLPHYQTNIHRKIQAMRNPAGHGLQKATESIQELSDELSNNKVSVEATAPVPAPVRKGRKPVVASVTPIAPTTVQVSSRHPGLFEEFGSIGSPLTHFLETAGAVLIFTLFLLLQKSDIRDRLFRLFGSGHLNRTTTALDDAAQRVSRYLLTQSVVNASFGLSLGLGLSLIGVPNAPFWGVLGAVLRFIPYIGTLIAGLCPLILALAVFEGWTRPMLTFGVFASIEITLSAAIEPWLYGAHTGISSLAILVSAAFWTLLWGPVGLVLCTPLTVCLLVIGRHFPPLTFLHVLLGDEPVLSPDAIYYQRLLALDDEEAREIAQEYLKENSVVDLYDLVLIPALSMAEQDRHDNALEEGREKFIYDTTKDLIGELSEDVPEPSRRDQVVVCLPARDEADELVSLMLVDLLKRSGVAAESVPLGRTEDMVRAVDQDRAHVLLISALPPFAMRQARSLCRIFRRRSPGLKIFLGFWDPTANAAQIKDRFGSNCVDQVALTLREADVQVRLQSGVSAGVDSTGDQLATALPSAEHR